MMDKKIGKCPVCNAGTMDEKEVNFSLYGENLGRFRAEVCNKCGEEFFDEEASKRIDETAKEKGLYGLEADTKISELGTNVAVRLNKKLAEFFHTKKGDEIRVYPENKKRLIVDFVD